MANFLEKHLTDSVSPSQSEDHSRSQNNGIGKGKSVTVLLPGDVTFGDNGEVFMPNTIEMAVIKKPEKKRFKSALAGNGIHFSSEMSEEDVKKKLQDEFDILKNCRFCCASAADNRTKLNFHGERRVWDGQCIMRNVKGNSALYLLIEHEGTPREPQPSTSGLTYQQMFTPSGASSKACIVPDISDMFASNPASQQRKAAGKRKIEITTKEEKSCSSSVKQQKKDFMYVQQMQPMFGVVQPAAATQISSRIVSQQTGNQVDSTTPAQFQYSRNNTTTLGELPQQTLPTSMVQNIPPPHGHLAGSDIRENGVQVSQQPSSKQIIMMAAQGSSQQHRLSAAVVEQKKNCKPPVQRRQLEKQSYLSISVPVASLQGSSQPCLPLQPSVVPGKQAAQDSVKPVSMASGSQQRELIDQTSVQECTWQQVPSATAAAAAVAVAHKNVPVPTFIQETTLPSTEKLSVNERKRERHPHAHNHQENLDQLLSDILSSDDNVDLGYNSTCPEESTKSDFDTGQSEDTVPVTEIIPCKGSTKGGERFCIISPHIIPLNIHSCVAHFEGCGKVPLKPKSLSTLTGSTPKSLQGPGPVKVTLTSLDGSWKGGEVVFEYIDDPPTDEEVLRMLVKDRDRRRKLFDMIDKELSSNKPSEAQTSDSSGKTGPGSSSLNQSEHVWSVELLQSLVYKAAEIDGWEFIQMIFSTSAGKVVFNSYRNSATLPEDVARANGHLTLANYLQNVNSRLSNESNSDAGTEGIDWLELKLAVDEEQSLTSGTDDAQILKKCQPVGYPESDDDESDYFADDEISPCSSPSHNNVCGSENEDHGQNLKVTESSCEEEVNKEDNLPMESSDSSEFPLYLVRNQLDVIPSMKAENAGHKHKQLDSDDVESHSSGDDITEKEYENTVLCRGEVENWDTFGSEVISALGEASTGTTSPHTATHNVVVTNGSESGLEGDQKELRMIDKDENSRSRDRELEQRTEGQRVQLAYEKALQTRFVNVYRGRIFLIGQERAGKTSLKRNLLGLLFNPEEQSTEGIEVDASAFHIGVDQVKNWHCTYENKPALLELSKDTSRKVVEKPYDRTMELGKGNSAAATKADAVAREDHFRGEKGGLSKEMSFGNCDKKMDLEFSGDKNDPNKQQGKEITDDITKRVQYAVRQLLNNVGGEHVDCDITEEESVVAVDLWDFAGEHLYYASHPMFLSSRAVYVLVHNLSKPLQAPAQPCVKQGTSDTYLANPNNETNLDNLLSWLVTVHGIAQVKNETDIGAQSLPYLRPPVFIVGTHAEQPVEDIAVMESQIKARISGAEYEKHVIQPLFSIDNTCSNVWNRMKRCLSQGLKKQNHQTEQEGNTDDIQELRKKIMEVLRQEPYMGQKIPVRWFLFEKVIETLIANQIYHRSLKQLQSFGKKHCFIEDADEFAGMISFYHGLGMIIKHRSTVVLKAQWLIDLFRQLTTIPNLDQMDPIHYKYWLELEANGILCTELIDHVFSKFIQQRIIKDDILDMMEQFGLIAKFSASPTDVKYFVPAQLKSSPEDFCQIEPSHTDPCPLYIHFVHGFVPLGLFSQLVSRSIRWCCKKTWPMEHSKLYQNGAWFFIGKQVHNFILICKKSFIKIVLTQCTMQSYPLSAEKSEDVATQVLEYLKETLQTLSQELPHMSGLQYEFCVACPYCNKGTDGVGQGCPKHGKLSCEDEECFHLLGMKDDQPLICTRKVCDKQHTVHGLEKWFFKGTSQDLSPSTVVSTSQGAPAQESDLTLGVTVLASGWSSSKRGLPTVNRELAMQLAKHDQVEVTILVPESVCTEEEKRFARSRNISIREAERRPGYDPLDWLSFPPRDLAIDIVVGCGVKLGKQAQVIRVSHRCKWVQVVDTEPEELGMYKSYPGAVSSGEEKTISVVDLCKLADAIATVGRKMKEAYSSSLYECKKHQDIIQLTPGTFGEFSDVTQATNGGGKFKVLAFGRGDPEDFCLKGYDIAAKAIAELKDNSYCLIFVGAPDGKQEAVAKNLIESGISRRQLYVRKFNQRKERMKELFCEVDLAIMPSRTEGFGLVALEALSAGLPILVSGDSGFGCALRTLPSGNSVVVDSEEPKDWARAIAGVRQKDRTERLQEIEKLRKCYEEKFSWEKQCEALVEMMQRIVREPTEKSVCQLSDHAPRNNAGIPTERLLKTLPRKEREPTITDFGLDPTKPGRTDVADKIVKHFSPSEDHKGYFHQQEFGKLNLNVMLTIPLIAYLSSLPRKQSIIREQILEREGKTERAKKIKKAIQCYSSSSR